MVCALFMDTCFIKHFNFYHNSSNILCPVFLGNGVLVIYQAVMFLVNFLCSGGAISDMG